MIKGCHLQNGRVRMQIGESSAPLGFLNLKGNGGEYVWFIIKHHLSHYFDFVLFMEFFKNFK